MSAGPMPLFVLDQALLPGGELPLHVFEPRYRTMIMRCMQEPRSFGIVRVHEEVLAEIGCEAVIVKRLHRYPDGRFDVLARGVERIRISSVKEHEDGYLEADVAAITEGPEETDHTIEDRLEEMYKAYAAIRGDIPRDVPPRGPRWSFRLADRLRLDAAAIQELLEMMSENDRLKRVLEHLAVLIPALRKREQMQEVVRGNGKLKPGTGAVGGSK